MILDIQRKSFYFIPTSYCNLFSENGTINYCSVVNAEEYSNFISFLESEELIFSCQDSLIENFSSNHLEKWLYPAYISNAVLEFELVDVDKLDNILLQLEELNCRYCELIFVEEIDYDSLSKLLGHLSDCNLWAYSLSISFSKNENIQEIIMLLQSTLKLFKTVIFNHSETREVISNESNYGNIFFVTKMHSHSFCGIINEEYFTINIDHYIESQSHNTCLNRKIAIDSTGKIKNCPSMAKSYGNVKDTKLVDVVNNSEFQKLWYIHKGQIATCKDCEFRHICTDCRAYLEDPEDIYSKPLKCGYNPYTCEWEEWSTNPLKQQAIDYYEMREIISNNQ